MKRPLSILLSFIVLLGTTSISEASAAKAGARCSKAGQISISSGKKFTCIKSGKKLVWNSGVAVISKPAISTPTPSASPSVTPTASPSASPSIAPRESTEPCKLPAVDGRGDVSIGGWPRIKERQKTTGTVQIKVVMVDFPDAPATRTPQQAFALFSGGTAIYSEVSYGKLNFDLQPTYKWYRMSKPSTEYAPLNKSFQSHRSYIQEAINLADPDIDFSTTDGFLIIANPDSKGIGTSGPAFSALTGWGITVDGNTLLNGATSSHDINNWGAIWLNHEMTHTMGLVDLYAATPGGGSDFWDYHRYVGQFSYMGFSDTKSNAPSLLAYERWYLGWINDDQIICSKSPATQLISPVQQSGGTKAIIIPLSQTKEIVIESRRPIGLDSRLVKSGALIYVVDSTKQSGLGPVQIYPQDLVGDPKYLQAPRKAGESISIEGYKISVIESSDKGDVVKVEKL